MKPVLVLSGFLGSGKTTLLNRLLKAPHGLRLAVIINELGEIGLDGALVSGPGEFVLMNNGCLCCVLNEDLAKLLTRLKDRSDFDAVVIETTGVANPLPVAWTFLREPLDHHFRLAGLVTVVDCLGDPRNLQPEGLEQILNADVIYFSRTDCALPDEISAAREATLQLKSQLRIIEDASLDFLTVLLQKEMPHDPLAPPGHTHAMTYRSLSLDLTGKKISLDALEDFFSALPAPVLRAKAVFEEKSGRVYAAHSVCGRFEFAELETASPVRAAVFIGKEIDDEGLKQRFFREVICAKE